MVLTDRIISGTSAYSKVGYETCTRLSKMGHQIAHTPMAKANRMGKQAFDNILIYPSGDDYFAEDVAMPNYLDFHANMLISIKEPWVFNHIFKLPLNFVPMVVVDHSPISPAIISRLPWAFKLIAISRHAQKELRSQGMPSHYIPHGVRTDLYKPLDKTVECRKLFYLDEDVFTVGIVALNRARKLIPRMLRGYRRFIDLNPDVKTQMMLWTNVMPRKHDDITVGISDLGVNLLPEITNLKLHNYVHWPKWEDIQKIGGLPEWDSKGGWDMVRLYNTMDVLLLATGGEGFGLPYIEAQCCGVPAISTNYAAGPEQIGSGYTVKAKDYAIINTPGTRFALPSIDHMAECLAKVCNGNREKQAKKARTFALRYDWNIIMDQYWTPFIKECEEELYPLVKEGKIKTYA